MKKAWAVAQCLWHLCYSTPHIRSLFLGFYLPVKCLPLTSDPLRCPHSFKTNLKSLLTSCRAGRFSFHVVTESLHKTIQTDVTVICQHSLFERIAYTLHTSTTHKQANTEEHRTLGIGFWEHGTLGEHICRTGEPENIGMTLSRVVSGLLTFKCKHECIKHLE